MVKQGYKQTEVGMIPEDWSVETFANVGDYYKGGGISMKDVRPSGFPCIMYGDIYVKFDTHFNKCDYHIDLDVAQKSARAQKGDVFFTASGETAEDIGRCVTYQGSEDIYIGGDIIAVRPFLDYDGLYLAYVQNSNNLKKQKASYAQGHSVVHISSENIKRLLFACPLLPEQKLIAKALSDVDSMISSIEKLIAKKKAVKQGAMQELLTGKKRLFGFTGKWVNKTIGEYGTFVSGNGFPMKYQGNPSERYPFYKVSDFNNVGNSRVLSKANNYISDDIVAILSCNIIPKDSIVFAKIGAAISLERKRITAFDCCIDNNMMSFQPYRKEISPYMCYLFQTIRFSELVEATALPSLSGKTIGKIKKMFPPTMEEQIAIASILSAMDSEIETLEQKLAKTRQVKQGMMQQLLTGIIRLDY